MRYQAEIKESVRRLRRKGYSLHQIKENTSVPITTIRTWIQDIALSDEQKEQLTRKIQNALQKGRIKAQSLFRAQRMRKEKELKEKGEKEINSLTINEFFIAGIALYWAEGFKNKHEHRLGFCNSDPEMISFYIEWLEKTLGINREDLILRLTLNVFYKERTKEIESYWSKVLRISLGQFTKPFYQNTAWRKQYKNKGEYHGVLRIHVKDSLNHLLKMRGWIEGIKSAKIGRALPG